MESSFACWRTITRHPTVHAYYGEYEVTVTIRDGVVIRERSRRRALRLTLEWRELHETELMANWEQLAAGMAARPIVPLS